MLSSNTPIVDWSDRTVWLIGASDGIGLALGQLLQTRGATLVVSARRAEALAQHFPDPAVLKLPLDVNDSDAMRLAVEQLQAKHHLPDVVVWMVGQYEPTALLDLSPQAAKAVLQTNLLSAYDALAAVLPAWRHQLASAHQVGQGAGKRWPRPHWVFVSSVAGYRGLPRAADYGASKAGLSHLAQVAHIELKPMGMDVSLVSPGFVSTRLTAKNSFKMPAVITPEQAAHSILKGLAKGPFEIHFPKRLSLLLKLLGLLPIGLYLRLIQAINPRQS
jgi:NAD(P)-dependent dehydrogenase (short-subunit alcohol dehydrogenase family)